MTNLSTHFKIKKSFSLQIYFSPDRSGYPFYEARNRKIAAEGRNSSTVERKIEN
jgi:hypothetical protein